MNRFLIITVITTFPFLLNSQVWEDNLLKHNSNATNIEKFNAFEEYKSQTVYTKGNGFKPYARNIEFVLQRTNGLDRFPKTFNMLNGKNKKNYIQLKNLIMRQIGFQKDLLTLQ